MVSDALHGLLHGVLTVIGVNNAGGEIEPVLQSGQYGAEGAGQAAGTGVEDQHTDDCFQGTAEGIIPLFTHQCIAQKCQEAHHVRGLLQYICRKKVPD